MSSDTPMVTAIIDNGTKWLKAGFGGEDAPRVQVPTLVGRARHPGVSGITLKQPKDNFVGPEAVASRGLLTATCPITRGIITDWTAMEELWHYTMLSALQVSFEDHPLIMTEAPDTTRNDREKLTEKVFETFNAPALVVSNSAALSLMSTGRTTGIVVDSGAAKTHVCAVWEGYCMPHFTRRIEVGGDDLTTLLISKLRSEGYPFSTEADKDVAERIKEQLCYCCENCEKELAYCTESRTVERLFDLPDGQQVYINENRFLVPEVLFNPKQFANPNFDVGLHLIINDVLQSCDKSIHEELYGSIVLGGGNTLFEKLDERVQRELSLIAPHNTVVKVVGFPVRQYAAWIGASMLASLSTFPCMWVSKNEYDDYGPSIIHRKS